MLLLGLLILKANSKACSSWTYSKDNSSKPVSQQIFESLDSGEIKALAGLCDTAQTDMNGRINGLYAAADSFGRVRMF